MNATLPVSQIEGVRLTALREIADQRGAVLHVLRADAADFTQFGECYVSEIVPGAVKAWKRHRTQTQLFAVPGGRILLVIYDPREESASVGRLQAFELGRPDAYARLCIPPGLWYGFSCLGASAAMIVNCPDLMHDPQESETLEPDDASIPYDWASQSRREHGP